MQDFDTEDLQGGRGHVSSPIVLTDFKATNGLTLEKLIIPNPRTIVVGRWEEG